MVFGEQINKFFKYVFVVTLPHSTSRQTAITQKMKISEGTNEKGNVKFTPNQLCDKNDINLKIKIYQGRVDWIDIAKGIGILLVVLGHAGFPKNIQWWIWSFHMPLFFFISGYLFSINRYPSLLILFKKRNKGLMRPYFFFSLLVLAGFYILEPSTISNQIYNVALYGWWGMALWFIPVMYITELIFYFPRKIFTSIQVFFFILTLSIIGYVLSLKGFYLNYRVEVVFTSIFFYGLGNILKDKINSWISYEVNGFILLFSALALALNITFCFLNETSFDMYSSRYGNYFYSYISAISGIAFTFSISSYISNNKSFQILKIKQKLIFLGTNTFILLALHQIIMMVLIDLFLQFSLSKLLSSLIRHSILWCLLILYILVINKFFPFILGKEKK